MDRLQAMEVFTKVVELNSFSKAAEALEITPASASTIIQKLEEWLNVRLLNRTTRKLNLTPEGAEYYRSCVQVLAAVEESEHALVGMGHRPRGKLRIDMPGSLGKIVLVPQIPSFRTLYPEIDIMIGFSDRDVDLVEDGVDCAIRVGPLRDSTLVAKKIGLAECCDSGEP
ncbi:LysR family transcriptional regulator [Paraburkholderia bengalensis]|uniref:LysR family transcriptional regulator n=1 Tax=Paraburkholderia bengalensis TaxID=2747562 RepID=UPI003014AAD9